MKENSLLKTNMRHKSGYMHISCWLRAKYNQINALLAKLSGHIPKFLNTDVFPYGESDFSEQGQINVKKGQNI